MQNVSLKEASVGNLIKSKSEQVSRTSYVYRMGHKEKDGLGAQLAKIVNGNLEKYNIINKMY